KTSGAFGSATSAAPYPASDCSLAEEKRVKKSQRSIRISVQAVAQAMAIERPREKRVVWQGWASFAMLALAPLLLLSGCTGSVASLNSANPAPVPPAITTQPNNQTVVAGQAATFMVVASGTAPMSYQWQKNGANIVGATSSSYTTPRSEERRVGKGCRSAWARYA